MKRVIGLAISFLILGLIGCGDPRSEKVTTAINLFEQAASQMQAIQKSLAEAEADATKKDRKLVDKDFETALKSATDLAEVGKKLLKVRSEIEDLQEGTTAEEKEQLDKRYRDKLTTLFDDLNKTQKEMDTTLAKVEKRAADEKVMKKLRDELQKSQQDLITLTKPR
jgi:phosphoenolpyruvate carboxylase